MGTSELRDAGVVPKPGWALGSSPGRILVEWLLPTSANLPLLPTKMMVPKGLGPAADQWEQRTVGQHQVLLSDTTQAPAAPRLLSCPGIK